MSSSCLHLSDRCPASYPYFLIGSQHTKPQSSGCRALTNYPSFQGVLTVATESEPVGVQVVEQVGLVDLFRAVFAKEVGGFFVFF